MPKYIWKNRLNLTIQSKKSSESLCGLYNKKEEQPPRHAIQNKAYRGLYNKKRGTNHPEMPQSEIKPTVDCITKKRNNNRCSSFVRP